MRYLGDDLDQSLDGKLIVEAILKNVNSRLIFLWRQAKFLNQYSKSQVNFAWLFPLFYAILIMPALLAMVVFKNFTRKYYNVYKIKQSDLSPITLLDRTLGLPNLKS